MYNRYIPQPDGSYRRNRMPEPHMSKPTPPPPPKPEPCEPPGPPPPPKQDRRPQPQRPCKQEEPLGSFLRQLLPKDFDTGDLIVILLLLLMAGDCEEDRNNALLTLALYFMM